MNKKIKVATILGLMLVGVTAMGAAVVPVNAANIQARNRVELKQESRNEDKHELKQESKNETNDKVKNDKEVINKENIKVAIAEDQAKQIALASMPGGVVKSIELEKEDGVIAYNLEITSGTNTYDVKIDANSGTILTSEQDKEDSGKEHSVKENPGKLNESEAHQDSVDLKIN